MQPLYQKIVSDYMPHFTSYVQFKSLIGYMQPACIQDKRVFIQIWDIFLMEACSHMEGIRIGNEKMSAFPHSFIQWRRHGGGGGAAPPPPPHDDNTPTPL